jgi:hypothetical protein
MEVLDPNQDSGIFEPWHKGDMDEDVIKTP